MIFILYALPSSDRLRKKKEQIKEEKKTQVSPGEQTQVSLA